MKQACVRILAVLKQARTDDYVWNPLCVVHARVRWRAATALKTSGFVLPCVCVESRNGLQDSMPRAQPETLTVSCVEEATMIPSHRLKLRHALSATQLRILGVGTASDGWSFPARVFEVKNVTGQYVSGIGHDNIEKEEKLMVSAVLTRTDEVAPETYPLSAVAKGGWVRVLTGPKVLPFTGLRHTCKEPADLSDIKTPETPSPRY